MNEEIFGPLLPIITVKGPDEAIDIISKEPKPLAIYVFTDNKAVQEKMVSETSSGGMVINDAVVHVSLKTSTSCFTLT
jgi:acyl-CoA reductase-like NAD-dependent aldehyde dehydrogenase